MSAGRDFPTGAWGAVIDTIAESIADRVAQRLEATLAREPEISPAALSTQDAARYLGLADSNVRRLIATGQLEAVHIGRRTLIRVETLDAFLTRGAA